MENIKMLIPTLRSIQEIEIASQVLCRIPAIGIDQLIGNFRKAESGYQLEIVCRHSDDNLSKNFNYEISIGENTYSINSSYITQQSINDKLQPICLFIIYSIKTIAKDIGPYYRLAIPLEERIDIIGHLECQGFKWEKASAIGLVKIAFQTKKFEIFEALFEKQHYLYIDCLDENDSESFSAQCFSILLSLGIITGTFIQNESYTINSKTNDFSEILSLQYSKCRKTLKSPLDILSINPHDIVRSTENPESFRESLHVVTTMQLSTLVEKVHNENDLASAALLMLEASTYPLDTQPACLSVALEAISNWTYRKNEEKLNPVSDKKVFREIRCDFHRVLESYKHRVEKSGLAILNKKIAALNTPTNRDKLISPFKIFGIVISESETRALNNRNAFLHSRPIKRSNIGEPLSESECTELFDNSLLLIMLLYRFFFRLIGFKGSLVNLSKVYIEKYKDDNEIPYFIEV